MNRSAFTLVLASGSPRRRALLKDLGLRLKVVPTEMEEIPRRGEDPVAFAKRMAREKAERVSLSYPDLWVLGADTIVVLDGKILGKPRDGQEAGKFLRFLSGKTHQVVSGFCLRHWNNKQALCRSVSTQVTFKALTAGEIDWYVKTAEPLDKAGAYAIQGRGAFCVRKIRGSYTNVVGLPLAEVLEVLEKCTGFHLSSLSVKRPTGSVK
ncbi:MAG: Maf family protein [Thermodesulfobacteriota bacterium]